MRTDSLERVKALVAAKKSPEPPARTGQKRFGLECIHRGAETGESVPCGGCGGKKKPTPVYECAVKGKCTLRFTGPDIQFCRTCPDRKAD
jgi:hypothetical protein